MASASQAPNSAALALLCLYTASSAVVEPTQATGVQAGMWRTPRLLVGHCNTVWTTSFAKYKLPYPVSFGATGHFRWWAPYKHGDATEVGEGMYLSPPVSAKREDGSWEVHYFSANRYTPDAQNSTLCCCEYVGGLGPGKPRVLADYMIASVPASNHRPMPEVCAPFKQACPIDNATALQTLGSPFIEIYDSCEPSVEPIPQWALAGLLALLVALGRLCFMLRALRRRLRDAAESADDYSALAGEDGWTDPALCKVGTPERQECVDSLTEPLPCKAARQESVDSLASTMPPASRATTIESFPAQRGPEAC